MFILFFLFREWRLVFFFTSSILSRIINHFRIENLANDRTVKKLLNSDIWSAKTYTHGKHKDDMNYLNTAQKSSSIDRVRFLDSIDNFEQKKSKFIFKQILINNNFTTNIRIVNNSHTSLTKFFNPCTDHPIIHKNGKIYETSFLG